MRRRNLMIGGLVAAVVAAGLAWAFWPRPLLVEIAEVQRGPMQATVSADGVTRVRDPFLVTAPLGGIARRSPVAVGDKVIANETIVAIIEPAEPAFLDARARAQAEAALAEAAASVHLAQTNLVRAETELDHALEDFARDRTLAGRGIISERVLDESEQLVETRRAAVEAARSELAMREATYDRAEAQLLDPEGRLGGEEPSSCCINLRAPQSGTVLNVEETSARLVQPGEPLLTIGDLAALEIEVDLLSSDAVRLSPGAPAMIERWGGDTVLSATVRRIDPQAFRQVSALGIEEQRVRVILDFVDPPEERPGLGDGYRVYARIVNWQAEDAVQVPVNALFRADGGWAVYRVEEGRATLRPVTLGNRTQTEAQVLEGLDEGDRVVAFPGNRVADGTRVAARTVD